jgi:RsiW-degrading membrane proteinase PrsW (M82 family)
MDDKSQILSQRKILFLFLALIITPVAISIILANLFLKNPSPDNTRLFLEAAQKTNNKQKVLELYSQIVPKNPLYIDFHYAYIHAWFDSRQFDEDAWDYKKEKIYEEYLQRSQDQDPQYRDIGCYGLGLIASINKKYDDALSFLQEVQNRELKYLNNSIGYVYYEKKEYETAEKYFKIEIKQGGNLDGAVSNLCRLLYQQKRFEELNALSQDPNLSQYVSQGTKRLIAFHLGKWKTYIQYIFRHDFRYFNLAGFLGSVLATLVWYFFLRNLDVFEPEKHRYLFITFLLGAAISPFCLVLYDAAHYWFHFDATGHWFNDLIYCIFGIGLFEELVKVIPFLLILFFTRQINESIDYIIYASLGALGFAFMENIMYFSESRLYVMEGRSMVSALTHMIDTSLVGYGIFLGKSKRFGRPLSNFFLFFFLACLLHGMFDYWIICKSLPTMCILFTLFITVFAVILYNRMIVNSLNQSRYFDQKALSKLQEMRMYLGVALISLVIFQYWVLAAKFGPDLATLAFLRRSMFTIIIIYIFSFHLSRLELRKSVWLGFGETYDKIIEITREPTKNFQIEKLPEEEAGPLYAKGRMFLLYIPWLVFLMGLIAVLIFMTQSRENEVPAILIFLAILLNITALAVVSPIIRLKIIRKNISRRKACLFDPKQPLTFLVRIFDMEKELKGQKGEMGIWLEDKDERTCFFEGETLRFRLPVDAIQSATIYQHFSRRKGFRHRLQAVLKIRTLHGVSTLGLSVIFNVHKSHVGFDFLSSLKEMLSCDELKKKETGIGERFPVVNAEVMKIPQEYAGKILTSKTIFYLNLIMSFKHLSLIICLFMIVFGFAFICMSYTGDPEMPVSPVSGFVLGFMMLVFGGYFELKLIMNFRKGSGYFIKYLSNHCIRVLKERNGEDIFVSPSDPDKILVEIFSGSDWGRMKLESATDLGFLKLDKEKREILYEGDRIRFRIPVESILSCDMQSVKGASALVKYIVIRVKIPTGFREFHFRKRISILLHPGDSPQVQLFDQITAMIPQD